MHMSTGSDILLKAASRIEEEGMWCRSSYYELPGGLEFDSPWLTLNYIEENGLRVPECALGAIYSAARELYNGFNEFSEANAAIFTLSEYLVDQLETAEDVDDGSRLSWVLDDYDVSPLNLIMAGNDDYVRDGNHMAALMREAATSI